MRSVLDSNSAVNQEVNFSQNRSELGCVCFQNAPQLHYPDNDRDAYVYDDDGNPTTPIPPSGPGSPYPGGTLAGPFSVAVALLPYIDAKSCGVPYDLPDLAGSLPSPSS